MEQEYQKYEFCKSAGCLALVDGDHCAIKRPSFCEKSAKEFHHWLKENGYRIVKDVTEIDFGDIPERCSPVEMRKCLEMVEAFKKGGIQFIPMPVVKPEDKNMLLHHAMRRLDFLEETSLDNGEEG